MSTRLIPTSRGNGCPVCGDETGKDRFPLEDPDAVLCMHYVDAALHEVIAGYKVLRPGNGSLWAVLRRDNSAEWNEEKARENQQRRERIKEETERQHKETASKALSAEEKDRGYRLLLENLGLSQHHTQKLIERRFTLEQIQETGYKSYQLGHQIRADLPANLPGLKPNNTLNVRGTGILLPIRNFEGLIVALQIRFDAEENGNRYSWVSTRSIAEERSPHVNGELPLSVYHPKDYQGDAIYLTEGAGLKPDMACIKTQSPVVASPGGLFMSSPETLSSTLSRISEKYGTKKIVICPDGGDVINNAVRTRIRNTIFGVQKLGYEVEIGWWNQYSKAGDDIDELNVSPQKYRIKPEEFWKKIAFNQDWENWVKSRKFTPTVKVSLKDFKFENIPDSNVIVGVKSGLGTNKTGAMLDQIPSSGRRIFIVGYLNNLLFQTIERGTQQGVTIYHLQQDDGFSMLSDENTHICGCLDSIHHMDGYFEGADIYLDEAVAVLLHAIGGGTLGDNQERAIKILSCAVNACNRVFLLDGGLADRHVDLISKLAPQKRVIKIENTRKISPHKIKIVDGIDIEEEIVKVRDKSGLIKMLCGEDVTPWIASDSKDRTKVIGKILTDSGKPGNVLNSETSGEAWAKDFLANPDSFIGSNKPGFLAVSPTAQAGISVTTKDYFTHKFSFFCGVFGTTQQHQQMFRLRDDSVIHYVYCPEKSSVRDRNSPRTYSVAMYKQIMEDRVNLSATLAAYDSGDSERAMEVIQSAFARNQDEWWHFSNREGALDQFEQDHLRLCLIHSLSEAGHEVEVINFNQEKEWQEIEKDAKESVRNQHAGEIFNAPKMASIEEAKKKAKSNPNKDVQRQIEKTYLLDRLPGIELSERWSADFILNYHLKERDFITKQQRFWLMNNIEISKKRHEVDWFYRATKQDQLKSQYTGMSHVIIWALQQLNVMQLVGKEFHKDSPEVLEIIKKGQEKGIATALGFEPGKARVDGKERLDYITKVCALVGLDKKFIAQKLINNIKTRVYGIDEQSMLDKGRLDILECIERKFTAWMASDKAKVSWTKEEPAKAPTDEKKPSSEEWDFRHLKGQTKEKVSEILKAEFAHKCQDPVVFDIVPDFIEELSLCDDRETLGLLLDAYEKFFDSRSVTITFIERISVLLDGKFAGFVLRTWLRKERGLGQEIQEEDLVAA